MASSVAVALFDSLSAQILYTNARSKMYVTYKIHFLPFQECVLWFLFSPWCPISSFLNINAVVCGGVKGDLVFASNYVTSKNKLFNRKAQIHLFGKGFSSDTG